ncbi:hypothetical protein D3C83_197540 [compost metagenome]
MSYAAPGEEMNFDGAVAACQSLVDFVCKRDSARAAAELAAATGKPTLGDVNVKDMIEKGRR